MDGAPRIAAPPRGSKCGNHRGCSVAASARRAPDRVRTEQGGIQANSGNPLREQARILTGREAAIWTPMTGEQEIAGFLAVCLEVVIDRLTGLLGDLELDRPAGLPLAHCRSVNSIPMRRDIPHLEAHYVTTPQLAIDCQIEERQIPDTPSELQSCPNGPNMPRLQWRLRPCEFVLVPVFALVRLAILLDRCRHFHLPCFQGR